LDKDGGRQEAGGERNAIDRGPLENVFGFLLRAAWRDSARVFAKYFRSLDINPQQYATLVLISRNPGCATGDLTEPLGVTANNIVRLIETLSERGLVEKTVDAADRRVRLLRLTDEGTAFLARLFEIHEHYDAEFREKLGADNIDRLCEILHRFD